MGWTSVGKYRGKGLKRPCRVNSCRSVCLPACALHLTSAVCPVLLLNSLLFSGWGFSILCPQGCTGVWAQQLVSDLCQRVCMFVMPETGMSAGLWINVWSPAMCLAGIYISLQPDYLLNLEQSAAVASPLQAVGSSIVCFPLTEFLVYHLTKYLEGLLFHHLTEGDIFQRQVCFIPFFCITVQQQHEDRPESETAQWWDHCRLSCTDPSFAFTTTILMTCHF